MLKEEGVTTLIGKNMSILEDKTSLLQIQDLLSTRFQHSFKPSTQEVPTYDFIFSAIWCKFTYQNHTGNACFLQVNSAGIDSIAVFVLDSSQNILKEKYIVAAAPLGELEMRASAYLVELPLSPITQAVYLRIKCDETLVLDLKVGSLKSFYTENIWEVWFNAIYFGIIMVMVVYNTFLFFSIKDIAYLHYILFGICIGITFATTLGYTHFLLGDLHWVFKKYPAIPASLTTIFGGLFLTEVMQMKKYVRWSWHISNFTIGLAIVNIVIGLFGYSHISSLMTKFFASIPLLIFLVASVQVHWQGYKPAKFFLIAFSGFTFFIILYIIVHEGGLIPALRPASAYFLQIGSAWEIVVLSLALAYKINLLKKEKQQVQSENLLLIKEQNTALEEKVKERTTTLETTVGDLQQTNEKLTQAIEISNQQRQEIEEQKEELSKLNNLKNRLLSIISHDLRSPIASLKSTVEILNPEILDKEDLLAIKGDISTKLENIDYALNNTLEWAKNQLSAGYESQKQLFKLKSVLDETLGLFYEITQKKQIHLQNLLSDDVSVYADIDQVRTIFRNLISNAIKFSHQQGEILVFQHLTSEDEALQSSVIIGVKDTGIGMTQRQIVQLFGIDTHFSTRGTHNEKGTGLGLLLCKDFVEKNNGKIWVESEVGKGSVFYFTLPTSSFIKN